MGAPSHLDSSSSRYELFLFFASTPQLDRERWQSALEARRSAARFEVTGESTARLSCLVRRSDSHEPVEFVLEVTQDHPDPALLSSAIEQSWNCRNARTLVEGCSAVARLSDDSAIRGNAPERVELLRQLLAATIAATSPSCIYSPLSWQVLDAETLLPALIEEPGDPLFGFVNVRLYKIDGNEGGVIAEFDETVMDTVGLTPLGLPDLQCHFKHLDPARVGALLYDSAHYVLENGAVIDSGHSLQGLIADEKWRCQLEDALIEPARIVVDVDPGPPYAAGGKRHSR